MKMPALAARPASTLRWLLVYSILFSGIVSAQTDISNNRAGFSGSVIGDDVLYSIGGGSAVPMGAGGNMQSLSVGGGWRSNLICGDMSLETTLQNQLNGLTQGFHTIMGSLIQNATGAVASLPALIIQRANPGLYNLLANGILQARLDFDRSKSTCRAIANRMADIAGGPSSWEQLAEGIALKEASDRTDAVAAIKQTEAQRGNRGVPWVGGEQAGGAGQVPIKIVSDITRAGYNLLNDRDVTDTSPIPHESCGNRLGCLNWPSPQAAADWANRVLGEQLQRTCDGCSKTDTTAGAGLTPLIQEEYEAKLNALQDLVARRVPSTPTNLEMASSNALPITRGLVEALREEPDQDLLGKRLASEAALSSVLEKALLLQRTLLTGRQEPNVAANDLAQQAIAQESDLLTLEIQNLKTELELRRSLAANTASEILRRNQSRTDSSRAIYQGDPEHNRLEQIERPVEGDR
ncbi:integrating conjugative element protein [Pseudomonas asplenii]|uniref:integrating conjugative element protein n=1 Tax=Pseudomonas asplenii TaxID=53407 RepID=UPI0037CB17FC